MLLHRAITVFCTERSVCVYLNLQWWTWGHGTRERAVTCWAADCSAGPRVWLMHKLKLTSYRRDIWLQVPYYYESFGPHRLCLFVCPCMFHVCNARWPSARRKVSDCFSRPQVSHFELHHIVQTASVAEQSGRKYWDGPYRNRVWGVGLGWTSSE
jgi:hypothetical protein